MGKSFPLSSWAGRLHFPASKQLHEWALANNPWTERMFITFWAGNESFYKTLHAVSLPSSSCSMWNGDTSGEDNVDYVRATRRKGPGSVNDYMDQVPPFTHMVQWCEWETVSVKPLRFWGFCYSSWPVQTDPPTVPKSCQGYLHNVSPCLLLPMPI